MDYLTPEMLRVAELAETCDWLATLPAEFADLDLDLDLDDERN